MDSFTVVWDLDAEDRLAEIWLHSLDRGLIRAAADKIDRILRTSPPRSHPSESSPELFEFWVQPLRVLYSISEPDRLVRVVDVEIDSMN